MRRNLSTYFLEEMDEAGVNKEVLVGRQAGHRIISNRIAPI